MSYRKRQRRSAQRRWMKRLIILIAVLVLILGLAGLIVRIAFDRAPAPTIEQYPMAYEDLILQYAAENGIPPAYAASVILAESSYRSEAVSSVGAQGLMQVMPATAEWIAGKLDVDPQAADLFDPETNIRFGCWYLGFLMDRFGGDMKCATAAYHAGQGTVDKWLADPECSPDGVTLETIPSSTTDTYVQRVLRYYEKYDELYAEYEA